MLPYYFHLIQLYENPRNLIFNKPFWGDSFKPFTWSVFIFIFHILNDGFWNIISKQPGLTLLSN